MSMVEAMLTLASRPSGVRKLSSGEVEGAVTRCPLPSSISQSRPNSAAPFMTGQARSRRNLASRPNA